MPATIFFCPTCRAFFDICDCCAPPGGHHGELCCSLSAGLEVWFSDTWGSCRNIPDRDVISQARRAVRCAGLEFRDGKDLCPYCLEARTSQF
jgi:hypothetical protein